MLTLTLIRHAKSSHDDHNLRDFSRPLNERGEVDAPRMGRYLSQQLHWSPDLLISSTATRAYRTARLLQSGLGQPEAMIQQEARIYEADVPTLTEIVQETSENIHHLALVGHNPSMENFANWLLGTRALTALVTCAVLILEIDLPDWSQLTSGCARLLYHLEPRKLPEA